MGSKVKYVVLEETVNEAYNMKDVQAIVAGLLREAKASGQGFVNLTIEIKR